MNDTVQIDFDALAERMLADYDAREPGTVFAEGLRLSLPEAWRLQSAVAGLREGRGETVVGYKIGCVCEQNQRQMGIPHPAWGRLWSTEQFADQVKLKKSDYANLAIEGEFAVLLNRDIDPAHSTPDEFAASVAEVFPVIELHNLVMRGAEPRGHELIANNAIHAGVVRGEGCKPVPSITTDLNILFDGKPADAWQDVKWPGDILQAVGWLVHELSRAGITLHRGDMILTGALGPPLPVADIHHVEVTSSQFGKVEAFFD
jgi:2-keto-4-pentenoate hydratase